MKEIKSYDTDEIDQAIICPYCKYHYSDSHDVLAPEQDNKETIECENCGKKFVAEVVTTVDYFTNRNCELNGENHEFIPNKILGNNDKKCSKCSLILYHYDEVKK